MPRPKTADRPFSFRSTAELMSDVRAAAERLDITDSKFINNALIMALKLPWVIQADWYTLRELEPCTLRPLRMTLSEKEMNSWMRS